MKKISIIIFIVVSLASFTCLAQTSVKWSSVGSFGGNLVDGDIKANSIGGLLGAGESTDGTNINRSEIHFTYSMLLSVDELEPLLPDEFSLSQNYPNPFNPSTQIDYSLPKQASIEIAVYNILGQKVTTLLEESKSAGSYSILWNGDDDDGNMVASGIYFYRIETGEFTSTKKMVLLK